MKRFIKRFLLFIVPLLVLFIGIVVLRDVRTKSTSREFSFNRYVNKVVIGDSHIANGIDDDILNDTKNIGIGGEGLIYSLNKIKLLHENNVRLDTVYLGISYHTFSDYFDIYIFDHYYLDKYFYSLPYATQKYFLGEISEPVNFFLKNVMRNLKGLVLNGINLDEMMGGYENYATDVKISEEVITERVNYQYFKDGKERSFSASNIDYFNNLVAYCKQNDITLIILQTPMHEAYESRVPQKFKDRFFSLVNDNNLKLIDFRNLHLDDEDFLPDGDHVARKGSILISEFLKNSEKSYPK